MFILKEDSNRMKRAKKVRKASEFASYCLELIENCGAIGPCLMKYMMGGWAISVEGYNFAFIVDLGQGEELWLKTDSESKKEFEKLGCSRFTYFITLKGVRVQRSLNYYSAPTHSLENPIAIRKYVEMALLSALIAKKKK